MLTAVNIHKFFGQNHVLQGVDVCVKPGEITCVIGSSGCGKTTLLRALTLIDYPDSGKINIDGNEYVFPLDKKQKVIPPWPKVTAVFQSLFLWPHMTLRENIILPARARNEKVEYDLKGLINLFEMEHFIDKYPNEASIGQRQRVALARALILNPDYIFMDEITSALDIEQSAKILTKLVHLKERGIGIFLITHQLGFTSRTADQVLFLDSGRITERGGAEILENPQTERLKKFLSMAEAVS